MFVAYLRVSVIVAWWKATLAESVITEGLSQISPLALSCIRVSCSYRYV